MYIRLCDSPENNAWLPGFVGSKSEVTFIITVQLLLLFFQITYEFDLKTDLGNKTLP